MREEEEGLLLLFGGQMLRFDADVFRALWSDTTEKPWVLDVIRSLKKCWEDFTNDFPLYNTIHNVPRRLVELEDFLQTGSMNSETKNPKLPNIILTPLVVIVHLVQYLKYLDMTGSGEAIRPSPNTGTVGFCTGLLSAFTVALSNDRAEVREYGATAVRLAMLIGGIVDAQNLLNEDVAGTPKALATAWSTEKQNKGLMSAIQRYPGVRTISTTPLSQRFLSR